jgi:hypothetical protein
MKKESIFLVALILFSLYPAFASMTLNNYSIEKNYAEAQNIKGFIQANFKNEPADSLFTSNFQGKIEILDLLRENSFVEGQDYNCTIKGCLEDYWKNRSVSSIQVSPGQKVAIGFIISGREILIEEAKIRFSSNSLSSCTAQAKIDVLDKKEFILSNNNYLQETCGGKIRGCFDETAETQIVEIGEQYYCQNMTLPPASAYLIGANLINSTSGQTDLYMTLFDQEGFKKGECKLPRHNQKQQDLACSVETLSTETTSYYVCIYARDAAYTDYTMASEASGEICGSSGEANPQFNRDFNIFAQPMKYGSFVTEINESVFEDKFLTSLNEYVQDYIDVSYGGKCEPYCSIPFVLESSVEQTISLTNTRLKFQDSGVSIVENNVWLLEKRPSLIDSNLLKIDLSKAEFTIPIGNNQKEFSLFFNDELLFKESNLSISPGFSFEVSPLVVGVGIETDFKITSNTPISKSSWKVDGLNVAEVEGSQARFALDEEKNYTLEVTATNKTGTVMTKTFKLTAGNLADSARQLYSQKKQDFVNFSKDIESQPSWIKEALKSKINLSLSDTFLNDVEVSLNSTNPDYNLIIRDLKNFDVPKKIVNGNVISNIPLSLLINYGELSLVEELSKTSLGDLDITRGAIVGWMEKYYSVDFDSQEIRIINSDSTQDSYYLIKVSISKKAETYDKDHYLIIGYPKEDISFERDYGFIEISSRESTGTYLKNPTAGEYQFMLLQEIDPLESSIMLAPSLSEIKGEPINPLPPGSTEPKGKKFVPWIYLMVIIAFFVTYIILQEWYKKYYETHLFNNKDDLFNLLNFIYNARHGGILDKEIKIKLKKSGWNIEQIDYAFKKLDGKRTGMFEIPIFKFFENRRVEKEIQKRHVQGGTDGARFIKRT